MRFDLNSLSLKQKVGQLIMFGFDGTTLNEHAIELIKDYQIGNVILFARNCQSPEQIFNLTQNLQKLALNAIGIPLFISIDQEGGMVTRILNGATFFPGAMTLAATSDPKNAYRMGELMGIELSALGINMNLAPVLDVNNNPKNPVIGVRSYSDDPKTVSLFGNAFIQGIQQYVIATAKHFPGHGDTTVDSHLGLPTVDYDLKRLEEIELFPFKEAIKNGIKAIMSAHIHFPKFTKDHRPATLSKEMMTGLLREKLGFEGLIVTDGMNMKAIVDHYGTAEASLMALEAGANQICVCHEKESQLGAYKRIFKAFETNELDLSILDERVSRVLKYKSELKLDLRLTYEKVKSHVENLSHQQEAYQMVYQAVTQIKGQPPIIDDQTLLINMLPQPVSEADDVLSHNHLRDTVLRHFKKLTILDVSTQPTLEKIDDLMRHITFASKIILCTYNANIYTSQLTLMSRIISLQKELHVLAFRNPYDLYFEKRLTNFACFYEHTPHSMKALVDYLKGKLKPEGRCPIHEL